MSDAADLLRAYRDATKALRDAETAAKSLINSVCETARLLKAGWNDTVIEGVTPLNLNRPAIDLTGWPTRKELEQKIAAYHQALAEQKTAADAMAKRGLGG